MRRTTQKWKPKLGERYYSLAVNDAPANCIACSCWDDDAVDRGRYEKGLVFKTRTEAGEMVERIIRFVKRERGLK